MSNYATGDVEQANGEALSPLAMSVAVRAPLARYAPHKTNSAAFEKSVTTTA